MRGFHIGKIAGFEINIDWSWLIIFLLVVYSLAGYYFPSRYPALSVGVNWLIGVVSALLLFASVLAHELMHSVVARRYGIDVKGITLFIFGGVSQTKGEPGTPSVEFYMAVAGPLMSFAIALLFYGIRLAGSTAGWPAALLAVVHYLAWINLVLGAFNLVPGFPLDGGRVLRSALWGWLRNLEQATRYASYAGQGVGYLLIAFGVFNILGGALMGGIWLTFIGWFLAGAARSSYEQVMLKQVLSGVEVGQVMTTDVPTISPHVTVDEFVHNYLMRHNYLCYPVVEDDQVSGIVSIDEVRAVPREYWPTTLVRDITQPVEDEITIRKEDDVWEALLKLATEDTSRLLVMHDSVLDGTVTRESIFRLVRTKMQLGV